MTFNPGSLVKPRWGATHMYESVNGEFKKFVGTMEEEDLGVLIDSGFSNFDVYYYKVLTSGKIGWIKAEWLEHV